MMVMPSQVVVFHSGSESRYEETDNEQPDY
jgi:hypothetical protein